MKKQLSAFELGVVVDEMQKLVDSKIDKIYQPVKTELILQFYVSGKGKKKLKISLPNFMYLTEQDKESSEKVLGFCMMLRKFLGNARLRRIRQVGFERVVEFLFEKKEGKFLLIVELFSGGNIVLCKEDYLIISPLIGKKWKERTIRGGVKYVFPKKGCDFYSLKRKELDLVLENSKKQSLAVSLATDIGLGGLYSEEVCSIANVDGSKKPSDVGDKDKERLLNAFSELQKRKRKPFAVLDNGKFLDVVPFDIEKYKGLEKKEFKSYNEALDHCLSLEIASEKDEKSKSIFDKEFKKLKEVIDKQNLKVNELEKGYTENQAKGEKIYENYKAVEEILREIKNAKEKLSWKEIKDRLKGHKVIKEVKEKEGKVVVEL